MRMSEEDARTRRDHARRNGSATEYDALHGLGLYARRAGARLRGLTRRVLQPSKLEQPPTRDKGTPHPW